MFGWIRTMVYESNVLTKRTKSKKFFQRSHFPSILCLSLYLYLYIYVPQVYCAQSYLTLCNPMDSSLPVPLSMVFSRQEYWLGCLFFLQGIFPTHGSNLSFLKLQHCRRILYHWVTRQVQMQYIYIQMWRNPKSKWDISIQVIT